MIKTIAKENYLNIFKDIIDAENEIDSESQLDVFDGHVYCSKVYEINSGKFPEYPELWGFWKTNYFVLDVDYSFDNDIITELTRVVKKGRTPIFEYWSVA